MESINNGDKISLYLDNKGYMGMGALKPESFKTNQFYVSAISRPSRDNPPRNFPNLCVFTIEIPREFESMGESILYGDTIQLLHASTGRYLGISDVSTSESSDKFICQLYDSPSANCQFSITPKHKMRNEGEQLYPGDQIILRSTAEEDSFVGCVGSEKIVTTQKMPEGWKIEIFSKLNEENSNALRGGDIIRLFHKEFEGFLSLRPNDLILRGGRDALEKVLQFQLNNPRDPFLLGVRLKSLGKEHNETNSVLSIWQIMHEDPRSGEPIEVDQKFRLKHLVTGLYIKVKFSQKFLEKNHLMYDKGVLKKIGEDEILEEDSVNYFRKMRQFSKEIVDKDDYKVTYTRNYLNQHTLFEAVPIASQNSSDYLTVSSLLRIKHVNTGSTLLAQDNTLKLPLGQSSLFDHWIGEHEEEASNHSFSTNYPHGPIKHKGTEMHKIKPSCYSREAPDEHVFQIALCYNIRYDYTTFVKTMSDELKIFLILLRDNMYNDEYFESDEYSLKIEQMIEVVELLDDFAKGKISWTKYDERTSITHLDWKNKSTPEEQLLFRGLKPVKRRQRALKEIFCLEYLFGIIDFFWDIVFSKDITRENLTADTERPWLLCKKAHSLIKTIVQGNNLAIAVVIELGVIEMMFQQISTGWDPCISEIFTVASGTNRELKAIDKYIVRAFIDQVEETLRVDYPHKIINFLASVCAPAGKGDFAVQKWVIELLIGTVSASSVPSNLIFHTRTTEDELHNTQVEILLDRQFFMRPIFARKDDLVDYRLEDYDEEYAKEHPKNWISLEEFLPNPIGKYNDLGVTSKQYSKGISPPVTENPAFDIRERQVSYYRSLLNLYRAACVSHNFRTQQVISALVSVDHILAVLNSTSICALDKQLYLDLFIELYVNSAVLGPLSRSVLPSILIWDGDKVILKWENNQDEKENKIFCVDSQPYLENLTSDWVSSWETEAGDEMGFQDEESVKEFTSNELIFEQRLNLHNYVLSEFLEILDVVTREKASLAKHLFGKEDKEELLWKHRLGYYISFCNFVNYLLLREFFEEYYNQDIESIEDFDTRKARIDDMPLFEPLMQDFPDLIPFGPSARNNLYLVMFNLATNILIETSPKKHYAVFEGQEPELYNKLFLTIEEGSLQSLLCNFKMGVIKLIQIFHDYGQAKRIQQLWDSNFKELYNVHFGEIDFNSLVIEKKVLRMYSHEEVAGSKLEPFKELNKYKVLYNEATGTSSDSEARRIAELLVNFRNRCETDENLQDSVASFCEDTEEFDALARTLLDIVLYKRPKLAIEGTNMLYRMFSQQKEIERVFAEAVVLLDDNYYKVYRLLQNHNLSLQRLTQNFTRIPTKPKDIVAFFKIFRAGNPLLDPEARKHPGLIDLCFSGVDLNLGQYTVFKRNNIFYQNAWDAPQEKKKKETNLIVRKVDRKGKITQAKVVSSNLRKKLMAEETPGETKISMEEAAEIIKHLSVRLRIGKLDLWAKNQELIRTVGIHLKVVKLLFRVLNKSNRNRFALDENEKFCQREMIKICYEFLYFFVWGNDANTLELTKSEILDMFFGQIGVSEAVPRVLQEIIEDNDIANELISEDTVKQIVRKLDQSHWNLEEDSEDNKEEFSLVQLMAKAYAREKTTPFPVQFISIIKAFIVSDIGLKPSRQKQVIEVIFGMRDFLDTLLMKDERNGYDLPGVLETFGEYASEVENDPNNLTKVLDPTGLETRLNFHLELVDLLGLCSRGNNIATTAFCRGLYDGPDSISKPLANPDVPICVRAPFTRFLHGVYFSDPKHKSYEEDQGIWSTFSYRTFKKIFINISDALQCLLDLCEKDVDRKKREDKLEEDANKRKQERLEEAKNNLKKNKKILLAKSMPNILLSEASEAADHEANNFIRSVSNDIEIDELRTFLELEQYGNYIFEIVLPFLTDLMRYNFQCFTSNPRQSTREKYDFDALDWENMSESRPDDIGVRYPMSYIFRLNIYLIVKLTNYSAVIFKEKSRSSIRNFMKAVITYTNDHFDDESSLLEPISLGENGEDARRQMQIKIITTINLLDDARDKTSFESGDLDLELIKERKEQSFIQEKALPEFLKAVSTLRFPSDDRQSEITQVLRKHLDNSINPEFSNYVCLLMEELTKYINWTDGYEGEDAEFNLTQGLKQTETTEKILEEQEDAGEPRESDEDVPILEQNNLSEEIEISIDPDFDLFSRRKPQRVQALSAVDNRDFDEWTEHGGRYLFKLIELLNHLRTSGEIEADCFHLKALQALLFKYPSAAELPNSGKALNDLDRRQLALANLGATQMVVSIISRARNPSTLTPYLKRIVPEILKIGRNLLSLGMTEIQDEFISLYYEACKVFSPNQFFLQALKILIREAKHNIKYLNTGKGDPFLSNMVPSLLGFIKNLCEGHHKETQEFLNYQPESAANVDVISELASFLVAASSKLTKRIVFITNPHFKTNMGPKLIGFPNIERKLIAWHKQNCKLPDIGDIKLTAQILKTLIECIQGPCIKNQLALTLSRCNRNFNTLLDFIGAFFYRKMKRGTMLWCGHGLNMYLLYLQTNPPENDLEYTEITQFCQLMEYIARNPDKDTRNNLMLIEHTGPEYMAYIEALDTLEQSILVYYSSMLEGNQNETTVLVSGEKIREELVRRIPAYVYESIDSSLYIHNLHNYWKNARLNKASTMLSELEGNEIGNWNRKTRKKVFLYYSLLSLLYDKYPPASKVKELLDRWERNYKSDMKEVVSRIEIQNSSQELEIVYFPKPPLARLYWKRPTVQELKEDLLFKISRETPEEKLTGFQDISMDLIIQMEHIKDVTQLPKNLPVVGRIYKIIANYQTEWLVVLTILTLIINVLIIAYLEKDNGGLEYTGDSTREIIFVLGFFHFIFSIISFLSYIFMKSVPMIKTEFARRNSMSVKLPRWMLKVINCVPFLLSCCYCFTKCKKYPSQRQRNIANALRMRSKIHLPNFVWVLYFFFFNTSTLFYISFMVMSALGAFFDPAYFAYHLVILIKGIRMTRYVLSSVTNNLDQVLATFLLAVIILFWFVMLSYNVAAFRGAYGFEDMMESSTFALYVKTHIAYGFAGSPIWGDNDIPVSGMFYVMIYFIIINLIMIAIVTGIIIDSFSEMRANSLAIKDDNDDRCFICNIDRDDFENEGINFSKHIKREHHLWNYLFFRIYLDNLDPVDMTGLESYVFECLSQNSITFFPIKKSLQIEGRNKEKKDLPSLFNKMDKFDKELKETREEFNDERERYSEETKRIMTSIEKLTNKVDELNKKLNNVPG